LGTDYQILGGGPILAGKEMAVHGGAALAGTQFYYMIVPSLMGGMQMGASTYSIGVWTEEYLAQYDTFGVPLKQSQINSAHWFCHNIPQAVGMNYFIYEDQRWGWHSIRMPEGAYDPDVVMAVGYQISTTGPTKYSFVGI
jgi:hypothetical protein